MNGWQIALLFVLIIFAGLTGLCLTANPFDPNSDMPIFGLLLWWFGGISIVLAVILCVSVVVGFEWGRPL